MVLLCCILSGSRPHQKCLPWLSAPDNIGRGVSNEGVLAAQWTIRTTSGSIWVISAISVLAWIHPHAPAVPREAWGWRVSFHRVRALWRCLVRLRPEIQRLPVCLLQSQDGTSEFLRLPCRLRNFLFLQPDSLSTDNSYILTLWDSCNAVRGQQGGIQRHQQGQSYWNAGEKYIWRTRTGVNSGASCTEAQRGLAFVCLPSLPSLLGVWGGVGLLLSFCDSPHIDCCSLWWLCVTVALWTAVGGLTEAQSSIIPSLSLWVGLYIYACKSLLYLVQIFKHYTHAILIWLFLKCPFQNDLANVMEWSHFLQLENLCSGYFSSTLIRCGLVLMGKQIKWFVCSLDTSFTCSVSAFLNQF